MSTVSLVSVRVFMSGGCLHVCGALATHHWRGELLSIVTAGQAGSGAINAVHLRLSWSRRAKSLKSGYITLKEGKLSLGYNTLSKGTETLLFAGCVLASVPCHPASRSRHSGHVLAVMTQHDSQTVFTAD